MLSYIIIYKENECADYYFGSIYWKIKTEMKKPPDTPKHIKGLFLVYENKYNKYKQNVKPIY